MSRFLFFLIFISSVVSGYSQCQPSTNFGNEVYGISPDTIENFDVGYLNQFYSQQVDVKIPNNAAFAGMPFISVSYGKMEYLNGLPPGLSYQCAKTASQPCSYIPGIGCMVVSGTPTQAGIFPLDIKLKIYTSLSQTYNISLEGYYIEIQEPVGIKNQTVQKLKIENPAPNPAHDLTKFKIESIEHGKAEIRVFDLVGKEIYHKNHRIEPGVNSLKYNTSQLPEGVYIYRIEAFEQSATGRLYIVH